ncbi:hypothetical protein PLESTM_001754800 [Pleodorina starrii]|nr:hypothetical protein PLESTM_001754800 [Pleodorina starrii]
MEWPIGGLRHLKTGFRDVPVYEGDGPRKARLLGMPTALVRQPDQVKMVLNGDGDLVEVAWPTATRITLGPNSVVWATGSYHKSLRRLLGPCFSPQAIEGYLPAIQRICERYCADWAATTAAAESSAGVPGGGEVVMGASAPALAPTPAAPDIARLPKLQEQARLLTFEVMATVVAGFRFSPAQLQHLSSAFERLMAGMFSPLPLAIPGTGFAKSSAARKVVVAALDEQINLFKAAQEQIGGDISPTGPDRTTALRGAAPPPASPAAAAAAGADDAPPPAVDTRRGSANGGGGGGPGNGGGSVMERLMGMMGDDGQPLSRAALQDMGITLLFAGHETTAASIIRLMMHLRSRPDVIEKLREEQRRAVAKHGDKITAAALREMPYLDAVVKEGWRVDPIVPVVPRRAKRDFQLNGFDIPQGWGLWLGLAEVSKQAPTWRDVPEGDPMDPRVFNPDRWRITTVAPPAAAAAAASSAAADADSTAAAAAAGGDAFDGQQKGQEGKGASTADITARGSAASSTDVDGLPPGMLSSPTGVLPPGMLTFGGGARYCLGSNLAWAEIKVFFAVLVRRYDVVAPLEHMDINPFPSIKVTGGFPILIRPLLALEAVAADD